MKSSSPTNHTRFVIFCSIMLSSILIQSKQHFVALARTSSSSLHAYSMISIRSAMGRVAFASPLSRRTLTFLKNKNCNHNHFRQYQLMSTTSSEEQQYSGKSQPKDDASYVSKSRMPFKAPQSAFDDSIPIKNNHNNAFSSTPDLLWSKLGLTTELAQLLSNPTTSKGMGFVDGPTPVQQMSIPAILSGGSSPTKKQSIAFAAATGSGKTLAYLLPIMQILKAQELLFQDGDNSYNSDGSNFRKPKRPRAIILAPTRELTIQIASVLKSLSHTIKLSTTSLVGGEDLGKQRKRLDRPIDILVSTPGRLVKHWNDGNLFLGSVDFIVLDEVDTMLEQGFQGDIGKVLHPLLYKHKGAFKNDDQFLESVDVVDGAPQIVMTSATMTNAVRRLFRNDHDHGLPAKSHKKKQVPTKQDDIKILLPKNMRVLTAPGLHRAVPRLKQVFIDVGNADKLSLLVDLVANDGRGGAGSVLTSRDKSKQREAGERGGLTLIFCNTVSSCRAVQHGLTESGIESLSYHGELNSAARAENLSLFREAGKGMHSSEIADDEEFYDDEDDGSDDDWSMFEDYDDWKSEVEAKASSINKKIPRIMVCTDIAARGLDVPEVDHVVMFDFPLNPIDYLHRAGRTARGVNQQHNKDNKIRAGSGRVSALVAKRDRVLAMAIEGAVQRGEPLDGLTSRKSDYMPGAKLNDRRLGEGGGERNSRRSENGGRGNRSGRGGRGGGRGGRAGRGGRGNGGGRRR